MPLFEGPSWSNRIFFYFCLFSFILIILLLVFIGFAAINPNFAIPNGPHYNSTQLRDMGFFDNERYLISTLVQSLAATIALVITLSLVAVQLAAQSYSTRVIEVYKNNPDMWILFSIYIAVIFYGLGLLKVIDIGIVGINMEIAIFWVYFLGFFAFICLVPYIWNTLNSLNISNIIEILSYDITKKQVLDALNNSANGKKNRKNPVQPIVDIINIGLERNDDEIVNNGISAINRSTTNIFEYNHFEREEEKKVSHFIFQHLEKIGIQAANKVNESSSILVILALDDIQKAAKKHELENATEEAAKAIEKMQIKVLEQRFEYATECIIKIHKKEGIIAVEQNLENIVHDTALILGQIGIKAIEKNMDLSASIATEAVKDVGIKATENKIDLVRVIEIIGIIERLGTKAAGEKMHLTAITAISALENMGIQVLKKQQGWILRYIINYIYIIGIAGVDKEQESIAKKSANALGSLGKELVEKKQKDFIIDTMEKLEIIAKKMFDKDLEEFTIGIAATEIGEIGIKAAEDALETTEDTIEIIKMSTRTLVDLGIKAVEKELILSGWGIIEALKNGGIKTVEKGPKNATREYKNGLEELMRKTKEMQWTNLDSAIEEALQAIEKAEETSSSNI